MNYFGLLDENKVLRPRQIPGLAVWLDASQIIGLNDGDTITQWDDLSGNNNHASQSTSTKRPLYKANIKNGLPVARFDGLDDFMSFSNLTLLQNVPYAACFAVLKTTAPGSARYIFAASINSTTSIRYFITRELTGVGKLGFAARRRDSDTLASLEGDLFSSDEWCLQTGIADYGNAKGRVYKNKNLIASQETFLTTGNTDNTPSNAIVLGASAAGASCITGDIGEVLLYNRPLTIWQKNCIDNYLIGKWGL